jgi:anti-sigma B factor antagonist
VDDLDASSPPAGSADVTFDTAGFPVIKLTGEVDMSNVDALREVIEPVMESEPERVDFDLSGLEFMDSSGIALLLRVAATAQSVYLREPSTLVRRLVEATGLSDVLRIEP